MESRRAEKKGKDQSIQAGMQRLFLVDECSSASSESGAESDAECPGCGLTVDIPR